MTGAPSPRSGGGRDTRRADLAKIHIAKKDLALDDARYRALLTRETGRGSAADLDAGERARVIAAFVKLGWQPRPKTAPHGAPAQRRKIARLLQAAGRPAAYAEGIARRMHNKRLAFCSPAQLRGVIAALMVDAKRRAA